ncbi:uncharacterized protein N7479_000340 [Penicillium vulpinum]|uniref:Zn(2)-C6 fungal-type domain-containing protein n=1 Tax=Penicillium vulpinum TaxID=29845 RepID=A0A1V6RDU2_9EURO|nr:uncharacterized protein N7479_000340 [Penicillium vulpinum]KAJ5970422.1 hypothetical protein N7479_000340 [Penicillium vulpinum]OQD99346.1 hypothetical protein PENVUL_c065G03058 [Penicillium vulpinum]
MSMLSPETYAQTPKRFACDRCREHKLRCPREDQTGQNCARCLRAGVPCITSNLRPLGRPARKIIPGNSHGRERTRKALRGQSGTADDEIDMLYDIDPAQNPINPVDVTEKPPAIRTPDVPSEAPGAFDANGSSLFGLDPAILLGLSGVGDNFVGVGLSNGQSPFGIPSLNGTHFPNPGDTESAYTGGSHISSNQSRYFTDESSQGRDSNSLGAGDPSKQPRKMMSRADAVQRLSAMIASLSKQLDRLNTTPWSVTLVSIVCANRGQGTASLDPLGEVLQTTSEFVHIIQTIAVTTSSTDQPGSGFQSQHSDPTTLSSSAADMFCSPFTSNLTNAHPFHISSSSFGQMQASELMTPPPSDYFKPDISAALVILTCYIQIIQIYNILFSRVYESLSEMSHQSISSLQSVPGLQLGGFPVQYGNLQVKILVQVIMHLLAHIESLLGTPADFRLDPARGSKDGLLSSSELTALLRMVMSQKDGKGSEDMGVGYISSLRENMKKIQQTLEQNPFL